MVSVGNEIDQIANAVVRTWGLCAQTDVVIEECAELIVALRHHGRGKCTADDVVSEIADVIIVARQIAHTFTAEFGGDVQSAIDFKLKRLSRKIERENDRD